MADIVKARSFSNGKRIWVPSISDEFSVKSVELKAEDHEIIIYCDAEIEADIDLFKSPHIVRGVKLKPFKVVANLMSISASFWLTPEAFKFYTSLYDEKYNLEAIEELYEDIVEEEINPDYILFRVLACAGAIADAWDTEDGGAISVEQDCGYICYKFSNSVTYNDICAVWNGTNEEIEVVYNRDGVDGYGIEEERKAEESLTEIIKEKIEEGNEDDIDWNNCFLCINYVFPIDGEGSVDVERGNIIKFAKDIPELKDYY